MSANPSNVIGIVDASEAFMLADLTRSGLKVDDFPIEPKALRPTDEGHARYRIHYSPDYYKDRIDRRENKYLGLKGAKVPMPILRAGGAEVFADKFSVAAVEGYKKTLLFAMTTGIPAAVMDSCWGFGISAGDDEVKQIKNELLEQLTPGKIHIALFDGDWNKSDVGKAIATYAILLDELGINAVFPDLGIDKDSKKRGYDDWFVDTFGVDRAKWPDEKATLKALLALPRVPVAELEAARSLALSSSDRFNKAHVDFSDRGNATLFTKLIGKENLRYIVDADQWAFWRHGRWQLYEGEPFEEANEVGRHYYRRADQLYRIAEKTEDPEKQKKLKTQAAETYKWAKDRCSSNGGRKAILEDVQERDDCRVRLSAFDANPDLLGAANGVLDLRTGLLREERRDDYILNRCAAAYTGAEPTGEGVDRVKMFVRQITGSAHGVLDATTLSWLQRRLGASLRGLNALDALEIWHGNGSNGKSVLASLIEKALGTYATSIPASVILSAVRERDPEAASPFMMLAVGKRIVFMSEAKDTAFLNEQLVKQITGGDRMNARGMYKDAGVYDVTFTPVLLVNDKPNVAQGDTAFWDRVSLFEFRVRWRRPNRTSYAPDEAELPVGDLWLRDQAKKDPKVLEWILWWLVQGGVEWEAAGQLVGSAPAHIVADVQAYQASQDKFGRWMSDEGWTYDPEARTRSADVYASYRQWMQTQGGTPEKDFIFSQRLIKYAKGKLTTGKVDYGKGALVGITRSAGKY
ncbi:hypothetical protein J7E49_21465 [Variovorax paradoxus]|nr:hypothetical protein [Variovorax paradoxus]